MSASDKVRQFARAEWGQMAYDVRDRLWARGLRAIPLTLWSCVGILCLQLVQHAQGPSDWVDRLGGIYCTLPWWKALLRTPLSLFIPDPTLPIWGLVIQVVVVFGIAETTLGARRTLAIALYTTLAGTTFARYSYWVGPDGFLGLPVVELIGRDTGPSAAVVALGVYVACRYHAWWTAAAVAMSMVIEVLALANLAGYEHLTAIIAVLLLFAVETWWARRRRRTDSSGDGPSGDGGDDHADLVR
ncbi:hypothetical protein ACIO6U_01645 [Streptomyces sp. NPDC087422]|uniref:hypothetical protein n=1 Tax=Streptomyces sp. NPDC087422 TaxID=3365786 RepID=UPI003814C780